MRCSLQAQARHACESACFCTKTQDSVSCCFECMTVASFKAAINSSWPAAASLHLVSLAFGTTAILFRQIVHQTSLQVQHIILGLTAAKTTLSL